MKFLLLELPLLLVLLIFSNNGFAKRVAKQTQHKNQEVDIEEYSTHHHQYNTNDKKQTTATELQAISSQQKYNRSSPELYMLVEGSRPAGSRDGLLGDNRGNKKFPKSQSDKAMQRKKLKISIKEKPRRKKHAYHSLQKGNGNNVIRTFEETHEHFEDNPIIQPRLQPKEQFLQGSEHYETHTAPEFIEPTSEESHHVHHIEEEHNIEEEHHEKPEKIKIKHHHHHHHHNHVKEIIKKVPEPYPVEKIVHVPVEKVVEKVIHVPKPYPVEKIVEKIVNVPIEKVVHVPKPYPVEKIVEKKVPYPVEKIVEKIVEKKVPYPVEKIVEKKVPYPVEKVIHVPVEKVIEKIIHVPKIVEKKVPYPVEKVVEKVVHVPKIIEKVVHIPVEKIVEKVVHIPKPYPVEKIVNKVVHIPKPYPVIKPVPYPVEVKVPIHIEKPVPYPVEKQVPVPYKVEVEKKVPVYIHQYEPYKYEKPINEEHEYHESVEHKEIEDFHHHRHQHSSHHDLSSLSSNQNNRHEAQLHTASKPSSSTHNSEAIRDELLRQQVQNFGYLKQNIPHEQPEQTAAESQSFSMTVQSDGSHSSPVAPPFLPTSSAETVKVSDSAAPSADLQPQASTNTLHFLSEVPSFSLPLPIFQLHPMPFQQPINYPSEEDIQVGPR